MKNITGLTICVLSLLITPIYAQIITRNISKSPETYPCIKSLKNEKINYFQMQAVDVKAELKKDSIERLRGIPPRFGKSFEADIDFIKQASILSEKDSVYYIYQIFAQESQSINLIFDELNLPEEAYLWIYSDHQIYGPVSSLFNTKGMNEFWTDIIKGSKITLQLTVPSKENNQKIAVHISKLVHGYNNIFLGFGDSDDSCERDVACSEGTNWKNEANSVAMVLKSDGTRFCSGSLINNVCQNFTPYFLTAFHCLDANKNGVLEGVEISAVSNWVFRFKYQSSSCGGGDGTSYVSLNGATFRAGFFDSDFTLLELAAAAQTIRDNNLSLAGWSRSTTAATSGVGIHHPQGDVKKISVENNSLTNIGVTTDWDGLTAPANTHWQALFETGTVEHGSSGSPFFNQNKQIVGQLHGDYLYGNSTSYDYCENKRGQYGRFDVSWTGGGSNATRLSNWLDPTGTGATTLNTLNTPNVSGPYIICTSANYIISDLAAGASVVWSSSNSSLLPINSSTGIATKSGAPSSNGWVTLTATITMPSCSQNVTRTKQVWVGPPKVDNINNTTGYTICTGIPETLVALPAPQAIGTSYNWTIVSASSGYFEGGVTNQSYAEFTNPTAETTQIAVAASNSCGSQGASINLTSVNCLMSYTVYPNPASDFITIGFDEPVNFEGLPIEIVMYSEKSTNPLQTIDVRKVFSQKGFVNDKEIKIDVKNLARGVYYLHFKYGKKNEPKSHRIVLE